MAESSGSELVSEKTNKIINDNEERKKPTKFSFKLIRILSMIVISTAFAIISYQSYPTYSLDNIRDSITFLFDDSLNVNNQNDRSLQHTTHKHFEGAVDFNGNTYTAKKRSSKLNIAEIAANKVKAGNAAFARFSTKTTGGSKPESITFPKFDKMKNFFKNKLQNMGVTDTKLTAGANTGVIICTVLELILNAILDPTELIEIGIEMAENIEAVLKLHSDGKENFADWKDVMNGIVDKRENSKETGAIRGIIKGIDTLEKLAGVSAFILSAACPPIGAIVGTTASVLFVMKYTASAGHWLWRNRDKLKNQLTTMADTLSSTLDKIKNNSKFKGDKELKDEPIPKTVPLLE